MTAALRSALVTSWGAWRGEALRSSPRLERGPGDGTADTDQPGRPVVVVTGMGIVTSLGHRPGGQLARADRRRSGIRRITRFPIDGLRTTIAGTVDSVPVDEPSAPASPQRLAELVIEEALTEAGIGQAGDFPGAAVPRPAAGGDGMDAAPRPRRRVRRGQTVDYTDLLRAADGGGNSSRIPNASCSARWLRTWRNGSAPRGRR